MFNLHRDGFYAPQTSLSAIKQRCYQNVSTALLVFYLSGAKVMPAPVRLEVGAHSARSRHILSQSCRIQTCFARVLKQVKSVNGLLIAQFPIN